MKTASPATYAIRVDGHLDDHWSARLGALTMARDDGTTTVTVSPRAPDPCGWGWPTPGVRATLRVPLPEAAADAMGAGLAAP